jgi:Transposase DDE domain
MEAHFAQEVLRRLPLAEAALHLWRWVGGAETLEELFGQHRGACYTDELTFPVLTHLVADALLEHQGSARKSFERGVENQELTVTVAAAYGKLRRIPQGLSEAFLAEGSARLQALVPTRASVALPVSLREFAVVVLDGKAIKRVPKRLKPLRKAAGGVLGGKALVALELSSGLALAMATSLDGDTNEASLVPRLTPQVRAQARMQQTGILWLGDRQFCDLTQPREFNARSGDHFVVRYHPRSKFCPDPSRPPKTGKDENGRTFVEDYGWLGAARNKDRRYVRRVTLTRSGQEDVILITDLLEAALYPASDLLALYSMRWGIERVFQQITEVFHLQRLIGTTPQGTLFQLAFCLLLYNLIQVIRAYIAEGADRKVTDISTELLFHDVQRQLIALHEVVEPKHIPELVPNEVDAVMLAKRLRHLLGSVWTSRWQKAPAKKTPPPPKAPNARTHNSAYRLLQQDRIACKAKARE